MQAQAGTNLSLSGEFGAGMLGIEVREYGKLFECWTCNLGVQGHPRIIKAGRASLLKKSKVHIPTGK